MVCSICGLGSHNARQCSRVYCENLIHELIDSTFSLQLCMRSSMKANNGNFLLAVLMGTHDRLGENSLFLLLGGHTDIIVKMLSKSFHITDDVVVSDKYDICEIEYFIGQNRDAPVPKMFDEYCYMLQDNRSMLRYPYKYNSVRDDDYVISSSRYGESVWIHDNIVEILWFQIMDNNILYTYNTECVLKGYKITWPIQFNPIWRFFIQHGTSANRITAKDNSIYIGCKLKNLLMCVRDGRFAWRQNVYSNIITEITVMDNNLYFATMASIYIITCKTGKTLYKFNMIVVNEHLHVENETSVITTNFYGLKLRRVDIRGGNVSWQNNHMTVSNIKPTVFKGLVIVVTNDKHLVALNKETGEQVWINKIGSKILNTPCVTDYFIYVGCLNKTVYKVNPDNGIIIWKYKTNGVIEDKIMYNKTNIIVLSRGTTCMYFLKK